MRQAFALLEMLSVLFALTSCSTPSGEVEQSTEAFYSVQKAYAAALEQALDLRDKEYRIIPVLITAYSRGSVIKARSPDLVTAQCRSGAATLAVAEDPMVNFPTITSNRAFTVGGGLSKDLMSAINEAVSFGAKVSDTTKLTLGYEGDKQVVIPLDTLKKFFAENQECARALAGQTVLFVRGQILAKMELISTSKFSANANTSVKKIGDFDVTWDRDGGFSVRDNRPLPHFLIVSEMNIEEKSLPGIVGVTGSDFVATVKRPSEEALAPLQPENFGPSGKR